MASLARKPTCTALARRLKNGKLASIALTAHGDVWPAGGWSGNKNSNGVSVYAPNGTPLGRIVAVE